MKKTLSFDPKNISLTAGIIIISFVSLFFRLSYNEHTRIETPIQHDAAEYVAYALNLVDHHVFSRDKSSENPAPDAFRTPGYPLFIAFLASVFGKDRLYENVILIQAILGSFIVLLTYMLARMILPFWVAVIPAILVCISPHLISLGNYILSETLFSFFLLFSILLFFKAHQRKGLWYGVLSGTAFGTAYLITPTVFFVPIFFLLTTFYFGCRAKNSLRSQTIAILVFLLFFMGNSFRNHLVSETQDGFSRALITMSHGTYPDFIYKDPAYQYLMYYEDPEQPEFGRSLQKFSRILWTRFKAEPARYVRWYLIGKPKAFWNWNLFQGQDVYVYRVKESLYDRAPFARLTYDFMKASHLPLLLLAIFGGAFILRKIFISRRIDENALYPFLLFVLLFYFTSLFVVFAPWPRYSIPLRPELYIFSVCSFYLIIRSIFKGRLQRKSFLTKDLTIPAEPNPPLRGPKGVKG